MIGFVAFYLVPTIRGVYLSFTEYSSGDILFKDKSGTDIPGNYTFVNSSMKAIGMTAVVMIVSGLRAMCRNDRPNRTVLSPRKCRFIGQIWPMG